MSLSRQQRRALERRGDRALARLGMTFVPDASAIIVVGEVGEPVVLDDARVRSMGLAEVADAIAEERPNWPGRVAVIVLTAGWASVAWAHARRMSAGGVA